MSSLHLFILSFRHTLTITLILLCAASVRILGLQTLPPGLYWDEAYYALDGAEVLKGDFQIYFPNNNGREPLFIYLLAGSIAVLGHTPFAVRLPAALVGVVTVASSYALYRALFGRRVALMGAVIAASSLWLIVFSRIGLRVGTFPMLALLMLAATAHGWRTRQLRWVIFGGALGGLTFYTYLAARLMPAVGLGVLLVWFVFKRHTFPNWRWLMAFALPMVVVALPLGLYALTHLDLFLGRTEQVSIFAPDRSAWTLFWENIWKVALMFVGSGDLNPRHNLPGQPVFDPLLGLIFVFGVGLALRRVIRQRSMSLVLVLLWVGVMLAPTIFSIDAPHYLRALGAAPLVLVFPALVLARIVKHSGTLKKADQLQLADLATHPVPRIIMATTMLVGHVFWSVFTYFGPYAALPELPFTFQTALVTMAQGANQFLNQQPAGRLLIDDRLWDFPAARFLLPAERVNVFQAGQTLPTASDAHTQLIVMPYIESEVRAAVSVLPPNSLITAQRGALYRNDDQPLEQAAPLYSIYTAEPAPTNPQPLAEFEHGIQLMAVHVTPTDAGLRVELVWHGLQAVAENYTVFVHVREGDFVVVGQDGVPATELYPTQWWRAGDWVRDVHLLPITETELAPTQAVWVGLYSPTTLQRLQRNDTAGDSVRVWHKP